MKIDLDNCKTSAQATTKICYNEKTRNLDFRITCESLQDLKECIKIIQAYNDFDWEIINQALEDYANVKRFYNEGNLNNGKDLLTFDIGRESSPVLYIKLFNYSIAQAQNTYKTESGEIRTYSQEQFEKDMKALGALAKADECDFGADGVYTYCRLWWD